MSALRSTCSSSMMPANGTAPSTSSHSAVRTTSATPVCGSAELTCHGETVMRRSLHGTTLRAIVSCSRKTGASATAKYAKRPSDTSTTDSIAAPHTSRRSRYAYSGRVCAPRNLPNAARGMLTSTQRIASSTKLRSGRYENAYEKKRTTLHRSSRPSTPSVNECIVSVSDMALRPPTTLPCEILAAYHGSSSALTCRCRSSRAYVRPSTSDVSKYSPTSVCTTVDQSGRSTKPSWTKANSDSTTTTRCWPHATATVSSLGMPGVTVMSSRNWRRKTALAWPLARLARNCDGKRTELGTRRVNNTSPTVTASGSSHKSHTSPASTSSASPRLSSAVWT
eukprot:Unigene9172_Nuclearia_a/m.28046 Unigene9172_Nuclearia_a/g.28046  ORF Unigene9172_Nuclearia_a/g.28046 Unigene9172_Nuclearia_a/m.28046 type:complete len:337 (+) Unigene9172_Nuclearia_a:559-1569(+)